MSDFSRTRGDDYPLYSTIIVDGVAIDITGDVVKFSYKNDTEASRTIIGTPTAKLGEVEFLPEIGVDFIVSGIFDYDIQRVSGGRTSTHLKGTMILDGDVTV